MRSRIISRKSAGFRPGGKSRDEDRRLDADTDFIARHWNLETSARILDCGCGDGRAAMAFAMLGFEHVTGLDASRHRLDAARQATLAKGLRIELVHADPHRCPFPDSHFDVVAILGNAFGHSSESKDDVSLLKEVRRVLRPGGMLWLDIADGDWLRTHFQAHCVEPLAGAFHYRHRELCGDGRRLLTRIIVVEERYGISSDRTTVEWLYNQNQTTSLLHLLGFTAISFYRLDMPLLAEPVEDARRYLVSCRSPRSADDPALRARIR